jgi:hypothetical protein
MICKSKWSIKMPFYMPMKGLRRNDDAMKTDAGITIFYRERFRNYCLSKNSNGLFLKPIA